VATDTITLDADTPLLHNYSGAAAPGTVKVFQAHPVALGAIVQTNYFSIDAIEAERATGRPLMWKFWKAALASGMTAASNADDFASTELQVKALTPSAAEFGAGGELEHLSSIIPANPMGVYIPGGDA